MVTLNHAIGMILSPIGFWFFGMIAVAVCAVRGWKRSAWWIGGIASAILLSASSGWCYRILGGSLERPYPPVPMEEVPKADAIFILGGGIGAHPKALPYPEMYPAADRVWHAARLWKAGKAPIVVASGTNELFATKPLLLDFGVPESAIRIENESRNTEENARFARRILKPEPGKPKPKLLLVTSAWHTRRALLMFRRYAPDLEIIPAPTDHEALNDLADPIAVKHFFPATEVLCRNGYMIKEIIGYYGYLLLRR